MVTRQVGVVEGDRSAALEEHQAVPAAAVVGPLVADSTDSMQRSFGTLRMPHMDPDRRNTEHIARRSLMDSQPLAVLDWSDSSQTAALEIAARRNQLHSRHHNHHSSAYRRHVADIHQNLRSLPAVGVDSL